MWYRIAMFAVLLSWCVRGPAAANDTRVLAPIHAFVNAANFGDRAKLIAAFTSDSAILDEFAPFRFNAPNAAAHWYDGFGADQLANGVAHAHIAFTTPKFVTIVRHRAYVVLPTAYTYTIHGKPASEAGSPAFALVERDQRWMISSMAWAKLRDSSIP